MSNVYNIIKNGHGFEVILDDDKSEVQTIIPFDRPEVCAIIQQTPCGAYLVSFVDTEHSYRVHAPTHARSIDDAIGAALSILPFIEMEA